MISRTVPVPASTAKARWVRARASMLHRMVSVLLILSIGLVVESVFPPAAAAAAPGSLVSVNPARVLETRSGPTNTTIDGLFEGIGRRSAGAVIELTVAGRAGVPANADAVFLNLTAVRSNSNGYLTVYPCGSPRPLAANVNYSPASVSPNAVLAKIGDGGKVCIYTLEAVDIVADVNGYVPDGGSPNTVNPARVLETRSGPTNTTIDGLFEGIGRRSAGAVIELTVAGRAGVPANADAVFLNLTAVRSNSNGYLTVYPCGSPRPLAANVNYSPASVSPNAVLAKIGDGGKVCIYTLEAVDIVADVNGYVPGVKYVDVAFGQNHGCAIDENAALTCWGVHTRGELGIGDTSGLPSSSSLPAVVPGVSGVTDVDLGEAFTCAVVGSNTASCWGNNTQGQIGDGTTTERRSPTAVTGLTGVVDITTGRNHACALLDDGSVRCWGDNGSGQLGDGTTTDRLTPVAVTGFGGKVPTAVDAGLLHTCVRFSDGTAACWGGNGNGRLGDGSTTTSSSPVTVSGLTGAASISAGSQHTCAVLTNGSVRCWGANPMLGNGVATGNQTTPIAVAGLGGVASVSAGTKMTCAVLAAGGARCWGSNAFGEIGNGTTEDQLTPVAMTGYEGDIIDVDTADGTSGASTCAVLDGGAAVCWGYNFNRELGADTPGRQPSVTPIVVGS